LSLTAENPSVDLLSIFVSSSNTVSQRAKSLSKQSGMKTTVHAHTHTHTHKHTQIYIYTYITTICCICTTVCMLYCFYIHTYV